MFELYMMYLLTAIPAAISLGVTLGLLASWERYALDNPELKPRNIRIVSVILFPFMFLGLGLALASWFLINQILED